MTAAKVPGSSIVVERTGHVMVIRMNRPEVCNAMNTDMYRSIIRTLDDALWDEDVRCVLLTGTGKYFAAGRDLTEFSGDALRAPHEVYEKRMYSDDASAYFYNYLSRYRKPLVTAVNGHAIGGGAVTAFLGDISISGESSYFRLPELDHGVTAVGATIAFPRLISRAKGMLLVLTCKRIYAPEAERLGLLSMVVPDDQLMSSAMEIATNVASKRPTAVRMFKAALQAGPWGDSEQADAAREAFSALADTPERHERTRDSAKSLGIRVGDDDAPTGKMS